MTTILLNSALLLAALLSAQLAVAWGELGSFPPRGDKSGMGGFGFVIMLMPMRWFLLSVGLAVGVRRVGFAELPGGPGLKTAIVLGLHLALGIVSYRVFNWIRKRCRMAKRGHNRRLSCSACCCRQPSGFWFS